MLVHACAWMFIMCKTLKSGVHTHFCMQFWRAHLYQWIHTTHKICISKDHTRFATLHMHCTGTGTIAIGNEMHLFAAYQFLYVYAVINSILPFTKYVSMFLLINTWKCSVETRVKLYIHVHYTIFSCFILWTLKYTVLQM